MTILIIQFRDTHGILNFVTIYTLGIGLLFIVESCLLLGVSVSRDARCINIQINVLS